MMPNYSHVVFFSGGVSSFVATQRLLTLVPNEEVLLLFSDTKSEDADLYRFLTDCELYFSPSKLLRVSDGRTIWEVFRDVCFLGNSRVAPCSRILKKEVAMKWINENCPECKLVFGIDYFESHRVTNIVRAHSPRECVFPLLEKPFIDKPSQLSILRSAGLKPPRLYSFGAPHNNCGGGCVKAGQAHFRWLYHALPQVYFEWEENERRLRKFLREDCSILRDRTGGITSPLTLEQFRCRIDAELDTDPHDDEEWGGCGCFIED